MAQVPCSKRLDNGFGRYLVHPMLSSTLLHSWEILRSKVEYRDVLQILMHLYDSQTMPQCLHYGFVSLGRVSLGYGKEWLT